MSNAGRLGSIGTFGLDPIKLLRAPKDLETQFATIMQLTDNRIHDAGAVVDAVSPIPVVAAGGIFDGRGLAAALVHGAAGVNVGTRFLASREAMISDAYTQTIVAASSEDAVKFDPLNDLLPSPGSRGYRTAFRSIRTPFIDELLQRPGLRVENRTASSAC